MPSTNPPSDSPLAITDIALAAYLTASGHPLRGIRREHGRGIFLFDAGPVTAEAVLRFLNRHAQIDAATFHDSMKSLKAAVAE